LLNKRIEDNWVKINNV